MNTKKAMLLVILMTTLSASWSCAQREVISDQYRREAVRGVSFKTLAQETDRYVGKTVILGGRILETKNVGGESAMTVLQAPLAMGEKPDFNSRSQGGFILSYKGYLEPEVYEKDRPVTVAGDVVGRVPEGAGNCPNPCIHLEYRQIYLWPMYESYTRPSFYEDWVNPYGAAGGYQYGGR